MNAPDSHRPVSDLASPDAQARSIEADRLLELAEDAERAGRRYIGAVLRKRVETMIGRAAVAESRARKVEEAGRARFPEDPNGPGPTAATS